MAEHCSYKARVMGSNPIWSILQLFIFFNIFYLIYIMKDENIRKKWEEFLNDEKYKKYL